MRNQDFFLTFLIILCDDHSPNEVVLTPITYGDELTREYLTTYTEAMQQAKLGLKTLLGK